MSLDDDERTAARYLSSLSPSQAAHFLGKALGLTVHEYEQAASVSWAKVPPAPEPGEGPAYWLAVAKHRAAKKQEAMALLAAEEQALQAQLQAAEFQGALTRMRTAIAERANDGVTYADKEYGNKAAMEYVKSTLEAEGFVVSELVPRTTLSGELLYPLKVRWDA